MRRKEARGFTLIELMVAVVIAGILMAIAIPNYQRYMVRSHRSEAQAVLMDVAQREQQYLLDNRAYTAVANAADMLKLSGYVVPANVLKFYDITVTTPVATPPRFTATATPKGAQSRDGPLTIDSTGAKTPSNKW